MRIAAALALVLAGLAPAWAAGRSRRPPVEEAVVVVAPAQYCQKMCPQDDAPCDPINFKTADARCAQIGAGR